MKSLLVDKNGDGIIDSDELEDKPMPDIMTASLMYSSLDLDGDGEVTINYFDPALVESYLDFFILY